MFKAKLIIAGVVIVLVAIVFFQNQQPVAFSFLFFAPVLVPKTVLILFSAVFGSLVTLLVQYVWRRRKRTSMAPAPQPSTVSPPQ